MIIPLASAATSAGVGSLSWSDEEADDDSDDEVNEGEVSEDDDDEEAGEVAAVVATCRDAAASALTMASMDFFVEFVISPRTSTGRHGRSWFVASMKPCAYTASGGRLVRAASLAPSGCGNVTSGMP